MEKRFLSDEKRPPFFAEVCDDAEVWRALLRIDDVGVVWTGVLDGARAEPFWGAVVAALAGAGVIFIAGIGAAALDTGAGAALGAGTGAEGPLGAGTGAPVHADGPCC